MYNYTPEEPRNLNAHDRLREQVSNLIDQVWIEGARSEDGLDKYVDQVLRLCGEEARKVLPAKHHNAMRQLFEKESKYDD